MSDGRPGRRHDLWDDDEQETPREATASERTDSAARSKGATAAAAGPAPSHRSRCAQESRKRRWLVLVAILLVLALCGGGAWAALGGGGGDDTACEGDPLTVAATPEIADALEDALAKVRKSDSCANFEISSTSAADAAKNINDGNGPDIWVPDSSTWVDAIDPAKTTGQWLEGSSIASSPVVLASSREQKDAVSSVSSWAHLVNQEGGLRMANPDTDTASRLAYHASRIGQPGKIGLDTGKRLIFMSRFAANSLPQLFDGYANDPAKSQPFPASEQQIAAWNEDNGDATPLRAVMPDKGTLTLDYPWITNPTLAGDDLKAAESARKELGSLEVRQALTDAGFRDSKGGGGPKIDGRAPAKLTALSPLDRNERIAAVEQWDVMRTDMRMLALIDASGSMKWDSPTPGQTRWDVTKGALLQGAEMLPAGSQVGAWAFSSDRAKGRDYEEIAPVKRLDAAVGSGSHRDRLLRLINGSDKLIEGDTALYDSIWAAHQQMVKDYDPDYVNSIVVFTDGENDDPNGGLALKQLLKKLDESYDPKRPVRVVTIGMGEADPTALQKIADETGGTSYIAETPDDIERVFVQALLARTRD